MTATIINLTDAPKASETHIAYNDDSVEAQLIRARRTIERMSETIRNQRQALVTISGYPYFEKERDEDGQWTQLSDADAHDFLQKAVTVAENALAGNEPPRWDLGKSLFEMMSAIGRAQVMQREIEQ